MSYASGDTLPVATDLTVKRCPVCHIIYAIPLSLHELAFGREHGKKSWYCPNGHSLVASGPSPAELLRQQLMRERAAHDQTRADRDRKRLEVEHKLHQLRGVKGVLTRTKRRIANGVCPCCNRYFDNLHAHMTNRHPGYKSVATEEEAS